MIFSRFPALLVAGLISINISAANAQEYQINGVPVDKSQYEASMLCNASRQLLKEQKWSEAEEKLKLALELCPGLKPARNNMGIVLTRLGKYREAIAVLKVLVDEDSSQAMAWATLGGAYMSVGEIEKAVDAYNHFLTLKPDYPEAPRYRDLVKGLKLEAARVKLVGDTSLSDSYVKTTPQGAPKWSALTKPLKVFVQKESTARGYLPQYETIVINAFKKWEKAAGGKVSFEFAGNKEGSDIECEWRDDPDAAIFKAEGGHAHIEAPNGKIGHVKIFLLTEWSKTVPVSDVLVGKLVLHEIGHALGIVGHSDNRDDIMFYSIDVSPREGQISQRDVKTLYELYK